MKPTGTVLATIIFAAVFSTAPASARTQPGTAVQAIITSRYGEFHRCYKDFVVIDTRCAVHHVHVPEHVAVGDYIHLEYGSNPKHYVFHVGRIIQHEDGGCTVRGDSTGSGHSGGKIKIGSCQPATK